MAVLSGEALEKALRDGCGDAALFDEDTMAFMVGAVEDDPPETAEALWDLIGAFLEGVGAVDDEDAGRELCERLLPLIRTGAAPAPPPKLKKAQPKAGSRLDGPIVMGATLAESGTQAQFGDAWDVLGGPQSGGFEEMPQERLKVVAAIGKAKKEKLARRVERRAWKAHEKTDHGAVWVDLPSGVSVGSGGAVDFHLDRVTLPNKRGSGDLFHNVTCTFAQGRKYGMLGRNGCGKSTFMDAVARRELPGVPSCSIFYVRQEVEGDERTPMEWVLQADSERQGLLAEKEKLETGASAKEGSRLAQVYQRLEQMDADNHELEGKALGLLKGLGFDDKLRSKTTQDLSGGWRMRVALACALFVSPGLLLLDEPTNHLDLETVLWLERYLREEFHQTLMIVSHDRVFLNEVVTDIVLFENETLEIFKGDYFNFEKIRADQRLRQERLREAQEMKREHLQEYITKHAQAGSNGCKAAAQRKARMRKLDKLGMEAQASIEGRKMKLSYDGDQEDVAEVEYAKTVTLTFPDPGVCDSLGNPLMRFDDAEFGYGDEPALFNSVAFNVTQSSRIAVLGKNGCGKSTLIKLLLGKLKPRSGTCVRHRGAKVEYIAQHHLDELDGDSSPLRMALERFPGDSSESHTLQMRMHLAAFGLGGETFPHQKIHTLSGGQKFRVSLALAMFRKPHLLVMDEPTNHLDLETIDAMIVALKDFQGGVAVVSHDEYLISQMCTELRVLANKKCTEFKGTIMDYKKQVLAASTRK